MRRHESVQEFEQRHPVLAAALAAPTPYAEYGAKLARLRKNADMSIMELAKAMGMRLSDISGIETGRLAPTGDQVDLYQIKVNEYKRTHPAAEGACTCKR